ncbi:efflux RND transporter periplasmic adaptor subunit [Stenotrophomonas sp. 24(2023)]|uniref:efflux RND transporter periplasmic adaptor subunit n=1 Tax=Stenotrophomonas sp. 24(2023) TaxID=3068324 RepID=UPI0027E125F7|nr:efflux RND transporter periplasmic adaptor subunit [Stenotrophomonas sp. 24(2023)]WMJ70839.1 efflux RND transporter periplasmic adaptor subunit [Stenotrophomonas sp. 24(2023)]
MPVSPPPSFEDDHGAARLGRRSRLAAVLALACLAVVLATLAWRSRSASPAVTPAPPVVARVLTLQAEDTAVWQDLPGRLEAVEAVEVRARVSGAVQSIAFREGAMVAAGDPLLRIDPAPYQAEVARVRAQLQAAQARAAYTQQEAARAERLWQVRAVSERDRDSALNQAREAQAQQATAQAALRAAELDLGYTQVHAPIAGRVGRRQVTVGNLVDAGPGAPVLTTLVSVDPIHAAFDADEASVARALADLGGDRNRIGEVPVQARIDGDDVPLLGQLQLVDNQVDATTGTVRLRARFSNPQGRLMPGQFVRLQLGRAQRVTALLVPDTAIGTDQDRRFVLLLDAGNRAQRQDVTLGGSVGARRIVLSGVQPGARIVVDNLQRVRAGSVVQPAPAGRQ